MWRSRAQRHMCTSPFVLPHRFIGVKGWVALVALAMVGCSQAQPAAENTNAPGYTSTSNGSSCRMPIWVDRADGTGQHGEFVDFPSGQVTVDPNGGGGLYYDRQISRWLPAPANAVSPDGSHYAIGGGTSDLKPILHIFDVATGADDIYPLPSEIGIGLAGPMVLGYTDRAIYVGEPTEGGMAALWTFDIATKRTTFMSLSGIGVIDGTTAWRSAFDATDTTAWSWTGVPRANEIEKFNLATGMQTLWLRSPGHLVDVIGMDVAHHPVVRDYVDRQMVELLLVKGESNPELIYNGSVDSWAGNISGVFADSHGIWLGGGKGVYLFTEPGGVVKVTDQAGTPAGSCA